MDSRQPISHHQKIWIRSIFHSIYHPIQQTKCHQMGYFRLRRHQSLHHDNSPGSQQNKSHQPSDSHNAKWVASNPKCKLDIPLLPQAARFGHILPSLAQHSLISVVKLCNAGCEVQFRNISCKVRYPGRVIMAGTKCQRTG